VSEEHRSAFAVAFLAQARSDWRVYQQLAAAGELPACHALHYLQMACEKISKAYRLRDTGGTFDEITSRHTGFGKFINAFLRSPTLLADYHGRTARHRAMCSSAAKFAREIEKLAPAVDRATSPENAEYPWLRGGRVLTPCEYTYPALSLLSEPGGRAFLRLVGRALADYETIAIH
jgi:hypothetical protein